jgi:hypothetical protein
VVLECFTHDGKENDVNHVFELLYKGDGYTALTWNDNANDECTCKVKVSPMNTQEIKPA